MIRYLVCPGLLGPLPRAEADRDLPRFPRLERFLTRAQQAKAGAGFQQTLFELFGLPVEPERDLPTAAICYQAEPDAPVVPPGAYLLHADPVYLRPDQDRLMATDLQGQALSEQDVALFVAAFNAHFAGDGLRLVAPHPQRWYLLVEAAPALQTTPLVEVLGRNLDLFLPSGADATRWHALLNEVQMLFHGLPINAQRETAGLLPVSGLWFSGGGVLPERPTQGFARCAGDSFLLHALNSLAASRREAVVQVDSGAERALCAGDSDAWLAAVRAIEAHVVAQEDSGMCLMPCAGRVWHWQPRMRYRVWRRTRPLPHWLIRRDA